ncbi:DUF6299 family protein [Streptomyces sp. NPDC029003]|uniref:DUF6299 family protein n=1 Tax=Streptomyces sp. NPDC029003 TaxID=3155125 RepID=UPI003411DBB9
MRTPARRIALSAFSALAATALFTAPAAATVFQQHISLRPHADIERDGTITLSGTYSCEASSPMGAVQVKVTVVQDDRYRLGLGAGDAHCDGMEHRWEARSGLSVTPGIHEGTARAMAELQEIHFGGGLMPRAIDVVAADEQEIRVTHRR